LPLGPGLVPSRRSERDVSGVPARAVLVCERVQGGRDAGTGLGRQDHLVVWNNERIRKRLKESPLTNEDRERLAQLGF